ncbi:MAG: hypothetical protein V4676_01385 [Bacteroidota bacterium]
MNFFLIVTLSVLLAACKKTVTAQGFEAVPVKKTIANGPNEISGIADSKTSPGNIWAHEDSGNPPELILISHEGVVQKKIPIKNIVNRDWEEMILWKNEIYIAEIGDNNLTATEYFFYKFPEPSTTTDTVRNVTTIRFQYSDGPHNAEAFLIDPSTNDLLIVTKNGMASQVYKIAFPFSTGINTATVVATLPYTGVVAAAQSPDGKEIILKTYTSLYYYKVSGTNNFTQTLQGSNTTLGYQPEPQGEAICFTQKNNGFFTLSEKAFLPEVHLYYYKRK